MYFTASEDWKAAHPTEEDAVAQATKNASKSWGSQIVYRLVPVTRVHLDKTVQVTPLYP